MTSLVVGAAPATAAEATPPSLSDFQLVPTNGGLQSVVDDLDARLPGQGRAGVVFGHRQRLYVVDTERGIRVFDMRSIFDVKSASNGDVTDSGQVGRQSGTYYSYGYRYVMPQVAGWSNPDGLAEFPPEHKCKAGGPRKFSYTALDRSETPDVLITGEYCADQGEPDLNGRVAQWPLDGNTSHPDGTTGSV